MKFKAPRGTNDIMPEEQGKWKLVYQTAVKLFEQYGYQKIVTPVFEQTELFKRGIGESTEIVEKEMYTFRDRKGRSLTLRPEGTAPVIRAYLEHNLDKKGQLAKLYYTGSMYRYERPQAGRKREFWQLGVEAIGSSNAALDAEVIYLAIQLLEDLGLRNLDLYLNNLGCEKCRPVYIKSLKSNLKPQVEYLCEDCQKRIVLNPLRVFDCKKKGCQIVLESAPLVSESVCKDCNKHFKSVKEYLKEVKLSYRLKPSLVRGLDYYTQTTFEVESSFLGAQNALGGGGRYDRLVEEYGGQPTPAVGFAFGVERVIMALEHGTRIDKLKQQVDIYLAVLGEECRLMGFRILAQLRKAGLNVDTDYQGRSLKGQLRLADKIGATYAIILGSDELKKKACMVKELDSGKQQEIAIKDLNTWIKSKVFKQEEN